MFENPPPKNESAIVAIELICITGLMIKVIKNALKSGKVYAHFFSFSKEKHPFVFKAIIVFQVITLFVAVYLTLRFTFISF
jgi:hypothetical protein